MRPDVLVLNGPNLGRLGSREPDVYGTMTLAQLAEACAAAGRELGLLVDVRQTDDEAELIGWVHEAADGTRTVERRTASYRAYTRAALTELASAAGLRDVRWHMPGESGFFQPVMTARSPT